ncbi:hypothetical protein GIB67_042976 [Kingdonia uniflora]|uniref:Uncharacterized protein n=1 Tax=Kingdonia uniflora TaxID=39325 RepID=A0A7J7NSY0_9MAGN|nr:hypothetical protein GIB67_042976 [Kingdonia uniflora]
MSLTNSSTLGSCQYWKCFGLRTCRVYSPCLINIKRAGGRARQTIKMDMNAVNNVIPGGAPLPSGSPFPGWSNWMLLTLIPMILPFFKSKWGPLLLLKQRADTILQEVEDMAELVEDAARKVDRIADDVTEKLPEGSKLKKVISMVDHVVEDTIKVADLAEEIIDRVQDVEQKVETLIEQKAKNQDVKVVKIVPPKSIE